MSCNGNSVLLGVEYRARADYLVVITKDNTDSYLSIPSSLYVDFGTPQDINPR